jgi:hypothetical protein
MLLPDKHILSKSTFVRGCQCLKSLYLYKNHYSLRDPISPAQQALFKRGNDVGILARDIFPGGMDASPKDPFSYSESIAKTRQLIANGTEVIYEASFIFDGVMCAIDILVKKDGKWFAYEVKSSAKVSGTYIVDAALQYYVITNSGLSLANICIINLNTEYVKQGSLELRKLFKSHSIFEDVIKKQDFVRNKIAEAKQILSGGVVPEINIGKHCFEPYGCDFFGHCWKPLPADSVFEIAGMQKAKLFEMYQSGITTIADVPEDFPLRAPQKLQVDFFKKDEPFIDIPAIQKFTKKLKYPLYFMDFETFMPAVPVFDGTSPFQHLPFQYSLHYKNEPGGNLIHKGFLAETGKNPCRSFIENLLKDTEAPGDILVYNLAFEKGVLKKLKKMFPELADEIQERIARMKDLMVPFEKHLYYHPKMKGSHSIKNVLPALVPELSYNNLEINNGNSASTAFEQLQFEHDLMKIAEIREGLEAYCKMDTLAMVKILEVLEKVPALHTEKPVND